MVVFTIKIVNYSVNKKKISNIILVSIKSLSYVRSIYTAIQIYL